MLFIGGIVVGDGINVVLLLVVSYSNHYSLLWRFFFVIGQCQCYLLAEKFDSIKFMYILHSKNSTVWVKKLMKHYFAVQTWF